ncbi:hypothetical protein F4821DRAFT_81178 [Hypoxylon rubiginosum]|uniref:Uncharacterized protein n=1 Tax=Hypoxylon rubiginosum TaxID=110542 RepID=A0ACC0D8K7_9PEZI|nr:hypothetical protein F4821DRAFT_81178 [Hypoxylon rubiginosum]
MASRDQEERLNRCEEMSKYVLSGGGNDDQLQRDTEDIKRVLRDEKELRENCQSTLTRLSMHTDRIKKGLQVIRDGSGKIDMQMLARKAESLEQAKFDNLVALILGRDGSLGRLRGMSQAYKDALLNSEKEQLQENLNSERDQLANLNTEKVRLEADLNSQRDRLAILNSEKERLEVRLHRLVNLKSEKDKLQNDLNFARALVAEKKEYLGGEIVDLYSRFEVAKLDASDAKKEVSGLKKSLLEKDSEILELKETNDELNSHISGFEISLNMIQNEASDSKQALADAQDTIAGLERDKTHLGQDVTSKNSTIANLETEVQNLTSLYDVSKAQVKSRDDELAEYKVKVSNLEHKVSELRDIQRDMDDFFAVQAGHSSSQDLEIASFVAELRQVGWVQGVQSRSPWTMLPPRGRHLLPDPKVEPAGLVELLTRLYGATLEGNSLPVQLLHLLTRQIGTANMLPLGGIVAVVGCLVSALETAPQPAPLEHHRVMQLLAFGVLQIVRCTRERLSQLDDRLEALSPRVDALVTRAGATIAQLANLVQADDGARLVRDLVATRDDRGDPVHRDPTFYAMFSSGTRLGFLKLPEWRTFVWVLSVDNRTIRAVSCEHGAWDGTANRYRISGPDEQDVVFDCHYFTDKAWLLRNMRQRDLN